jgi:BCD family chlorophyll transporter-like MFS transporter
MKPHLGWFGIIRLGLVQCALGAIAALTTSTLNRVMVVEDAMPAAIPAAFVAWHYIVQLSRPRWGYGSDLRSRRTPWIIGGVGVMALGAIVATDAAVMMPGSPALGGALAFLAYSMIGAGTGAAGTTLLALLASQTAPERRPAAAALTWILMIVGIVATAGACSVFLQPFSPERLASVGTCVAGAAFLLTLLAVWGAEGKDGAEASASAAEARPTFAQVLAEIRDDPMTKRFTLFVFVSMLAYSAQELILEPFAGLVFHFNPGQSAQVNGLQQGGVLVGMIIVGALGARLGDRKSVWMRRWTVAGCVGSAVALAAFAMASVTPGWPLAPTAFVLGLANGVFAVAAIGSMMGLAGAGKVSGAGARMGVFGAAQAIAFAAGGFLGASAVGLLRAGLHDNGVAFLLVFAAEAVVFLAAALIAARLDVAGPAAIGPDLGADLGAGLSGAHG